MPFAVRSTVALLVSLGSLVAQGAHPCIHGDDGFSIPCCQNALAENVPEFPALDLEATLGVLSGCGLCSQADATLHLGSLLIGGGAGQVSCSFSVDGAFPFTAGGSLFAMYARTWVEHTGTCAVRQVWRVLVNGDLGVTPTVAIPGELPECFIPACADDASAGRRVFFHGHIDYACDPEFPGNWCAAVSLSHLDGCTAHAPSSERPRTGQPAHPSTSYHLVSPKWFSFQSPFVPPLRQGFVPGDAVRAAEVWVNMTPSTFVAKAESPIESAQMIWGFSDCGCGSAPGPGRRFHGGLAGQTCCAGATFTTHPSWLGPYGLIGLSLGSWLNSQPFPGFRELEIYVGSLDYDDPCVAGDVTPHFVHGVGTNGVLAGWLGDPALACPTGEYPHGFHLFDLTNLRVPKTDHGINWSDWLPGYGSAAVGDIVWSFTAYGYALPNGTTCPGFGSPGGNGGNGGGTFGGGGGGGGGAGGPMGGF